MEKLDRFYGRIKGSYFGFIGTGINLLGILIAITLFMQVDPTFNLFSNYISDLGDGPNHSDIVFNISVILTGIILWFFYLYLMRYLQKMGGNQNLTIISFISGFIASIGAILVGIFTSEKAPELHRFSAALAFVGSLLALIFFGISEYYIPEIPKKLSCLGFFLAPLSFLFLIFFLILNTTPGFNRGITIFTEWLAYFANTAWLIIQGIYTLKSKSE